MKRLLNALQSDNLPVTILAAMMFLIPAVGVPNEYMLQDTLKSAIAAFGILLATMALMWAALHQRRFLVWHWIMVLPFILCLYSLASMAWGHPYLAGVEAIRWFLAGVLLWMAINLRGLGDWQRIAAGIHMGVSLASLWAALQFWLGFDLFPQVAPPASTFANRNFFAEYAVTALPVSVWLLLRTHSAPTALAMSFSIALNLTAILMTGTRSALVALLVLAPLVIAIFAKYRHTLACSRSHPRHAVIAVSTLMIGLGILCSIPTTNPAFTAPGQSVTPLGISAGRATTLAQGSTYQVGSFATRTLMWRSSVRMVMDQPWIGVGAGAWEVQIPRYQGANNAVEVDYYAHNDWLQLLSEYGMPLGMLWLAVLVALLVQSMRSVFQFGTGAPPVTAATGFAVCAVMGAMTVGAAGFPFHLAGVMCLTMLTLGFLASTQPTDDARLGPARAALPLSPLALRVLLCMGALALGTATFITAKAGRAEYVLVKAINVANSYPKNPGTKEQDIALAASLLREGLSINPHYRKIASPAADALVTFGDLPTAAAALSTIAQSRPHVPDLWANLVMIHANLRQQPQAEAAMQALERLQPTASRTLRLRILLLYRQGAQAAAFKQLHVSLNTPQAEIEMFNFAYTLGLESGNTDLALHALALRTKKWPTTASDGYFKEGMLYDALPAKNTARALQAFQRGYQLAPPTVREVFRQAVPPAYQVRLE